MEQSLTISQARKLTLRQRFINIGFIKALDKNLKYFCKKIREELRNEWDSVIAITGYPGVGKSQLATILGILIDFGYKFENICFIPTSKEIEDKYLGLPMFSSLHIDEASRGLHKQKWYDKVQQKLNQLYDTEREGHFLCTLLIMPRFQNFSENFRNFRIKYWINIMDRSLAIVYKRDEDKDAKDPWHIDENYKIKEKKWRGKRIFERGSYDLVRIEQMTKNYWFYFRIPEIPKEIWKEYQELKLLSREVGEEDIEVENYKEKLEREKLQRWTKIKELKDKGYTHDEVGAILKVSAQTIRRDLRAMEAYERIKDKGGSHPYPTKNTNIIYNTQKGDRKNKIPAELDKISEL